MTSVTAIGGGQAEAPGALMLRERLAVADSSEDQFRTISREPARLPDVVLDTMVCRHEGFHSCTVYYDRACAELICVMTCDQCGRPVREVRREPYSPRFDRAGCNSYLTVAR